MPDLIITDWEMPIMNGIEFIKLLKSNEKTHDIPVIMCTGVMTTPENLKTALDAGAVDYIRKPVEKLELMARVNSMLKLSDSIKTIKAQNNDLIRQREEILHQKEEIQAQNDNLEQANIEILNQKNIIEKSHRQITDSINYAKRIQNAILPSPENIGSLLTEHFILFMPRDIVSGDFYFVKEIKKFMLIAAADCTGHGVPGAFMSMLGVALLNEIVRRNEIENAATILEELRLQIKHSLQQTGLKSEQKDGMDIAFCAINYQTLEMSFAGAHNPCWILRDSEFIELQADSMPVGVFFKESPFNEQKFQLKKNDVIYIFSDGFYSQLSEENKYSRKKFREFLHSIGYETLNQQKDLLHTEFEKWKGTNRQTDDVLVMGVKI